MKNVYDDSTKVNEKKKLNRLELFLIYCFFGCLFVIMLISIYTFWYNVVTIFAEGIQHKDFYSIIAFAISLVIGGIVASCIYDKNKDFIDNGKRIYCISTVIGIIFFMLYLVFFIESENGIVTLFLETTYVVAIHNLSVSFLVTGLNKMIRNKKKGSCQLK